VDINNALLSLMTITAQPWTAVLYRDHSNLISNRRYLSTQNTRLWCHSHQTCSVCYAWMQCR